MLESGHEVSCLGRQTLLSALTWRGKNEQVNGERELRKHPVGIESLVISVSFQVLSESMDSTVHVPMTSTKKVLTLSLSLINIQPFKVLYFASAKDATGLSSEDLALPETSPTMSIQQLFTLLESKYPKLKQKKILSSVAVAVNLEYVEVEDGVLGEGDEVAIIPPVSGG